MSAARPENAVLAQSELTDGWTTVRLPEIANINMGQSPPGSTYNDEGKGLPFFQGKAEFGDRHPSVQVWCTEPKKKAIPGDVLISVRAPVGPTNVADRECAIGRGLAALTPLSGMPTEFLLFALRFQEPELSLRGTGSTFRAISKDDLEEIEIKVPPLAEQKRIVEKIEQLLARVSSARKRLSHVPIILKRFRQAVLAAACSGRLTADWREQHESRKEALRSAEHNEWADLPETWGERTVESVCATIVDCPHSTPKWTPSGVICVRTTNFRAGSLDLAEVRYVSESTYKERTQRLEPSEGDVLYSREGGILGLACLVPPASRLCLGQRMMLMRVIGNLFSSSFLMHVLNSRQTNERVKQLTGGSASPHLNVQEVKRFPVPLPSLCEQQEIVRRVEALFAVAAAIENRLVGATARAEKLTQAILAKAFRGELVPTEAELARREGRSYELASDLLARVRAANATRSNNGAGSKVRKRRNK
jgi:type I restriction enzyme, S subunit